MNCGTSRKDSEVAREAMMPVSGRGSSSLYSVDLLVSCKICDDLRRGLRLDIERREEVRLCFRACLMREEWAGVI